MQRWLARFSFTFLIGALLLFWHPYSALRGYSAPLPTWQIVLEFFAAVLCFALGMAGVRARHRPQD